VHNNGLKSTND